MTLNSSIETVAVLYDIENAPFEMLDYTLGKARKYLPCRMIIVSDWEKRPNQKRWNRLIRRPGYTFRQIDRKVDGKNSLDYALFDTAEMMRDEGVQRFFIITTDSDFISIAHELKKNNAAVTVIGVGTEQASQDLRAAYDEFLCYPSEPQAKKKPLKREEKKQVRAEVRKVKAEQQKKKVLNAAAMLVLEQPAAVPVIAGADAEGSLQVRLPKTLHRQLMERMKAENVDMSQLVTYLLMRGIADSGR